MTQYARVGLLGRRGMKPIGARRPLWLRAAIVVVLLWAPTPAAGQENGEASEGIVERVFRKLGIPGELSGFLGADSRLFFESPQFEGQKFTSGAFSLVAEPEWYMEWNGGYDAVLFVPFFRADFDDPERTHFDLRELNYLHVAERWEVRVGFARVFWGVIESQHLVDIINQLDLVEDIDGEDKLGQPMIQLSLPRDYGVFEFFVLPGFRLRSFPGRRGRLRSELVVAQDDPVFESSLGRAHVDLAGRWNYTRGAWDGALSHFYGTAREPRLVPDVDGSGNLKLFPHYDLINQTGLELQHTGRNVMLKFEAIGRDGEGHYRTALACGFEYTFFSIFDSYADLGVLGEFHFTDAALRAPPTPFEHDLFGAFRLALNDEQNTAVLAGATVDVKDGAQFWNIEASRRLGDRWTIDIDVRLFLALPRDDLFSGFRRDSYIQMRLARFF